MAKVAGKEQKWATNVVLVRHGESVANIERDRLKKGATKEMFLKMPCRDMDIPLTEKGIKQAKSAGKLLKNYPKFDVAIISPYVRAKQTAEIIIKEMGYRIPLVFEERIREKDFGVLDKVTEKGKIKYYPLEAEREKWDGKYYYRPYGGENYPDVALRIRSFFDTLIRKYKKENVLVVTHAITILMFRKLLEHLSEKEVLDIHANQKLKNGSISAFVYDSQSKDLVLKEWNRTGY